MIEKLISKHTRLHPYIKIKQQKKNNMLKTARKTPSYAHLCFDPGISLKEINIMFYNLYTLLCVAQKQHYAAFIIFLQFKNESWYKFHSISMFSLNNSLLLFSKKLHFKLQRNWHAKHFVLFVFLPIFYAKFMTAEIFRYFAYIGFFCIHLCRHKISLPCFVNLSFPGTFFLCFV